MANIISAKDLNGLLHGKSKFALIDVREAGEYNSSHIADSSLIPRKELEFRMDVSAPVKGELRMRRVEGLNDLLLKRCVLTYESSAPGTAVLVIGKCHRDLELVPTCDLAIEDCDLAYYDTDPLGYIKQRRLKWQANHRLEYLEPKLVLETGGIKLVSLAVEVAEV